MSILKAIKSRRSIREFSDRPVTHDLLKQIVTAGIWAPSGLNNQPWRFVLVSDKSIKSRLADLTRYSHVVNRAAALIVVYLDTNVMYDAVKDHQSAGACIQNMLLMTEELGLGGVWLGQILKNMKGVNAVLGVEEVFELMAVLAVGYPQHRNQQSSRKELAEFIIKEIGGN